MKNNVLLFACIEKNIGDDLFVDTLCKRYPQTCFIISSNAKYGSLAKIPNLKFSKLLQQWEKVTAYVPRNLFKRKIYQYLQKIYEKKIGVYDTAVNIVGNAFKNYEYTGWEQSKWIRNRIKLAKHFFLLSTNFGPYNNEDWKNDFMKIFPDMTDVCFRDQMSYNLFNMLPNVRYAPDAVLSIGKIKNTTSKRKKRVLISVIDCTFSARPEKLKQYAKIYEKKIIEIIDFLTMQDYQITIINSNTVQDKPACDRIIRQCKCREQIDVLNYMGNLNEIFDVYYGADAVIATRLHAIILSWLFCIPVLPIVYDVKISAVLKSYDFSGEFYDIHEMDNIIPSTIEHILSEYNYSLSDNIIAQANLQFMMLDQILK